MERESLSAWQHDTRATGDDGKLQTSDLPKVWVEVQLKMLIPVGIAVKIRQDCSSVFTATQISVRTQQFTLCHVSSVNGKEGWGDARGEVLAQDIHQSSI